MCARRPDPLDIIPVKRKHNLKRAMHPINSIILKQDGCEYIRARGGNVVPIRVESIQVSKVSRSGESKIINRIKIIPVDGSQDFQLSEAKYRRLTRRGVKRAMLARRRK